jgi:hypothetical protein
MRRRHWITFAIVLLGLVLGYRQWSLARTRKPPVELMLAPAADWEGIAAAERAGFGVLFKDCLEFGGGLAVVEEAQAIAGNLERLQVTVKRSGDQIRILLVRRRAGLAEERLGTASETPRKAITAVLGMLGLDSAAAGVMIPGDPEVFWGLAGVADQRVERDLPRAMRACGLIVERDPECAAAWLALARVSHLRLLTAVVADADAQNQCETGFLRALELAPGFPRAVTGFARFKTDVGNQRGALDLLLPALRRFPGVPRLLEATAYATRTSGLLDDALRALQQRDRILGLSRGEAGLTENTYLYRGDLATMETVLGPGSDQEPDSVRDFYRGYLKLLQGDRSGALRRFHRAHLNASGVPQFEALAEVYALGLEGQREPALQLRRRVWAERVPLRVPDGEYTFKLAEAFGFLGSNGEAQEVAARAFAQGFGCTRWYEQSPFLAGIRSTPRWNALQQHLQERQALLERSYPSSRFPF